MHTHTTQLKQPLPCAILGMMLIRILPKVTLIAY